jgi:signal peptidase I
MNINFELILVLIVLFTGVICLVDVSYFARKRHHAETQLTTTPDITQRSQLEKQATMSKLVEYSRAFFPVLFLVLLIRSFLVEPFRIPSGSLEPTLIPGDFVLTSKFAYGLRLPVLHNKIYNIGEPKAGQIFVFRSPPNPQIDFIKRVIGVPGDKVSYIDKVLYINGVMQPQTDLGPVQYTDDQGNPHTVELKSEVINGIKHKIYVLNDHPAEDFTLVVPPGNYFAMGDNRDFSWDSRYWGFVPEKNLIGKAIFVWLSWDKDKYKIRWDRVGMVINK